MIIIVHGDNEPKSRDSVIKIQNKIGASNVTKKNLLDLSPQELHEITSSFDIFSEPPFVVVDISDQGRKNVKEYIEVLKKVPAKTNVVLYSKKALSKSNAFIKATDSLSAKIISNQQIPDSNIFKFVDQVFYKNKKAAYEEYKRLVLAGEDPFYLFSMLLFGLRNIAYAKFDSPSLNSVAPFIKGKAKKQSENFSADEIKDMYQLFFELDVKLKTGEFQKDLVVPYTLEKVID